MDYQNAAKIIQNSQRCIAFTGAGISVESGVPPFRGKNGLWNRYNPDYFDINFFLQYPDKCWDLIRTMFYDVFDKALPNAAHKALASLEAQGMVQGIITQNVDNLHQSAGSHIVHEFHGSLKKLVCLSCGKRYPAENINLEKLPPSCPGCQGLLKPDMVFFGEGIPEKVSKAAFSEAGKADCFLLIGTTGTVIPANQIPVLAKSNGAMIIEINPDPSEYTSSITDIFIQEKAGPAMGQLMENIQPY